MRLPVMVRPEFWDDLVAASIEFEERMPGLGARFRAEVILRIENLPVFPMARRVVEDTIRRDLVRRFDYWILFSVEPERIEVLGLVYAGRNMDQWMSRRLGGKAQEKDQP